MAEGLNRWTGIGNLTEDAELRGNATQVLKFRVACNERYKAQEGWKERTEYVSCVMFGKRAEALANLLNKGSRVYVEGSLRTSSYEKDGQKRYRTEIVASNIILSGGNRNSPPADDSGDGKRTGFGGGGSYPDSDYSAPSDDEIPFLFVSSGDREAWWPCP